MAPARDGPPAAAGDLSASAIVPYERWRARLDELIARYRGATPYPHVVLDDFVAPDVATCAATEFPAPDSGEWIQYVHVNERKLGRNDPAAIPAVHRAVIAELHSPGFVEFLSTLTGIPGLFADDSLEGGGLHQSTRGGFLNVHSDFNSHPHHPTWRRRLNLLLYLNPGWEESWGGQLELWDSDVQTRVKRVAPLFNRAVVFDTTGDAFHGHPEPLACPDGVTRKSIALYYFTEESAPVRVRSTEYRARPGEGLWGLAIYLDTMVLRAYDRVKRRFGLNDRFASVLLKRLSRR